MNENWYDKHILPHLIDLTCGTRPIRRQREKVVPLAHGRVLEIGIGSGLNLPHYDRARVSQLVGLDPALQLHRLARRRLAETGLTLELIGLSAEKIPQADASFDTIVITYTLCSIPDPEAALAEMRRVLKPGGQLIYSEHGRAPDRQVAHWQDRLTPYWKRFSGGCHLNRDIPALLVTSGFNVDGMKSMYLPGFRPLSYHYWGVAQAT
ncbi:MAG TPA: class I SAM-dependent methyltransferase [Rhodocyclaceae bacterium]|nr:class I SAM-dependent methyltransferase [Rhodocyclaceae bacterium]